DAVVSVHYQGHPPCDLRDPKTCIPRGGYFVGTVAQDLDPAFVASQRLAANISRDYGAITGIRRAFNWDTSSLNITHYHLKNNDTLTSPIFHGYKLSGPTPFAIIEAGVGDTGGFDHDVLWANQAGVCLSIALGIIDFLTGNGPRACGEGAPPPRPRPATPSRSRPTRRRDSCSRRPRLRAARPGLRSRRRRGHRQPARARPAAATGHPAAGGHPAGARPAGPRPAGGGGRARPGPAGGAGRGTRA